MTKKNKSWKAWSQAEEDILLKNIENNVTCLKKAFLLTSKELQRTPSACASHWYVYTSKGKKTRFLTMSGSHVARNRKNGKGDPVTLSLFKRVLALLKLSF